MQSVKQQGEGQRSTPIIGLSYSKKSNITMTSIYTERFTNLDKVVIYEYNGDMVTTCIKDCEQMQYEAKSALSRYSLGDTKTYVACAQQAVSSIQLKDYGQQPVAISQYYSDYELRKRYKSNRGYYIEKAMRSHNCLWHCGIASIFKVSWVIINGIKRMHAYSLITVDNKYYIFDANFPYVSESGYQDDFMVKEIDRETYLKMIDPKSKEKGNVMVSHPKVLELDGYDIVYDVDGRKQKDKIIEKV